MEEMPGKVINQTQTSFPLVSVGLPTYNRPEGLMKCLEHLIGQTYSNIEIIISDNCSSNPRVQEIILEYAGKDNRIKHFRQIENIGLEGNFNFVFSHSKASFFMWMSDDDYFDGDYIEKCLDFLQKNPDYVLCSGLAKYYSRDAFVFNEKMFNVDQRKISRRIIHYFSKVGKNGNFYGVFRKEIFEDKPLGLHIGCDWVFMADLAVFGKLHYLTSTAYYRSVEGHSAGRKSMIKKFDFKGLKAIFFETYTAYTVSSNLFKKPVIKKKVKCVSRKFIGIMVFIILNWKFFFNAVSRRLFEK